MELKQLIIENKVTVTVIFLIAIAGLYQTGNLQVLQQTQFNNLENISNEFHNKIDYLTPRTLENQKISCADFGGSWYEESNRIGCYSMEINKFNIAYCSSKVLIYLKNICEDIGGKWVCDSQNFGCGL